METFWMCFILLWDLVCPTITYSFFCLLTERAWWHCQLCTDDLPCTCLTGTARSRIFCLQTHAMHFRLLYQMKASSSLLFLWYLSPASSKCAAVFPKSLQAPMIAVLPRQVPWRASLWCSAVFPRPKYLLPATHQLTHHTGRLDGLMQETQNTVLWCFF